MKAQVETRGSSGRRKDRAVIDVKDVWIDGREWRLSQRWVWCLGIVISGHCDTGRIYGLAIVPIHRHRLADAFLLGYRTPGLGQSHLAIHADIFVRLHDFRCRSRHLVYSRSSSHSAQLSDDLEGWLTISL